MINKKCPSKQLSKRITELGDLFRVLGEEKRLKIICLLRNRELCVSDIWQNVGWPQNLVSTHLRILSRSKLISNRREGQKIYYSINYLAFKKYNSILADFLKKYEQKD
ncbi:MAG: metalloregulator ArsR/SmtB family transcription factor [Planctomycetes bacterium]|jgi:ArsR family transcriptional regulator|nr:metalloregulator ArsR/SmtB family transcription factor [Planctomycetota bacterium]